MQTSARINVYDMIVSMNDCSYMYVYEFKDYIAKHKVFILLSVNA